MKFICTLYICIWYFLRKQNTGLIFNSNNIRIKNEIYLYFLHIYIPHRFHHKIQD